MIHKNSDYRHFNHSFVAKCYFLCKYMIFITKMELEMSSIYYQHQLSRLNVM